MTEEHMIYTDILFFVLISSYFDYLLAIGLNKIPCFLYEQLFVYTIIWLKRNILLGSILSFSYYLLC